MTLNTASIDKGACAARVGAGLFGGLLDLVF